MNTEYRDQMTLAYGPFVPGSAARDLRTENAKLGFKTCWNPACLAAYRPERVTDEDGRLHQPGLGRWYCSVACARADARASQPIVEFIGADTLVLDFTRCRECA